MLSCYPHKPRTVSTLTLIFIHPLGGLDHEWGPCDVAGGVDVGCCQSLKRYHAVCHVEIADGVHWCQMTSFRDFQMAERIKKVREISWAEKRDKICNNHSWKGVEGRLYHLSGEETHMA
ncbi:unnamed protein product [Cuscuta campestris]|uniref:Uncharacterized protein n=1 Tax=Cuscuta campestris TaxID=132261 RepID=A0A484ND95_9ASTE|nr:unnamed protein product [Cuscuta campestris]